MDRPSPTPPRGSNNNYHNLLTILNWTGPSEESTARGRARRRYTARSLARARTTRTPPRIGTRSLVSDTNIAPVRPHDTHLISTDRPTARPPVLFARRRRVRHRPDRPTDQRDPVNGHPSSLPEFGDFSVSIGGVLRFVFADFSVVPLRDPVPRPVDPGTPDDDGTPIAPVPHERVPAAGRVPVLQPRVPGLFGRDRGPVRLEHAVRQVRVDTATGESPIEIGTCTPVRMLHARGRIRDWVA